MVLVARRYKCTNFHRIVFTAASLVTLSKAMSTLASSSSMNCELYLVRHGETTANRDGLLQGHCDYPLTDKGMREAGQVGDALKDVCFTKMYASDLRRVQHTAEIMMTKRLDQSLCDVQSNALLRELGFGVREMLPRATPYEEAIKLYAARENIPVDEVVDPAETLEQIIERQRKFLVEVVHPELAAIKGTESAPGAGAPKMLCIAHGGFIKRFLKHYCAETAEGISNCSLTKVLVEWPSSTDKRKFKCFADPSHINITTHIVESLVIDDGSN